uniref:Prophage PSSB64-01 n=1 Tax=viral metagenome TaxID=1070528 RepID=A0A6H1ZG13_9ZZZZ
MTWAPVTMRWPEQATQWMADLDAAKNLAGGELASTTQRLAGLDGLATTNPGPVGGAAAGAIATGRAALGSQLGETPACLAVTPFQSGVGQGRGNQRFLSAPNLLLQLAGKLVDQSDQGKPSGPQYALSLLFLATRFDQLADTLARFNALLPVPDLVRAERRARHLSRLEAEKWEMPSAGPLPRWGALPLERCTVTKAAKQSIGGQLAMLESYAADSSPMSDLAALASRKASQQQGRDQQLADLKTMLAAGNADSSMRARLIGLGDATELRRQLLEGEAPGHEWVLTAGMLLVGSLDGLSFVRELVGL